MHCKLNFWLEDQPLNESNVPKLKILQTSIKYAGSLGRRTHRPSVWCSKYYFFFIISCKTLFKKCFNLFYLFFYIIKIKSFECPKYIRNYVSCLVNKSFVPSTQQTSVLYCRLTYFLVAIQRAVEDPYLVIHEYITEIWTFYESPNDGSVCHSMKTHIFFSLTYKK